MNDHPRTAEPSRSYPMVVLLRDGLPVGPELRPTVRTRRRRWLGPLAAAVALAAGLLWLASPHEQSVAEAPRTPPATVVAALQVAAPPVALTAAPSVAEPATAAEDASIEICGVGRFTRAQLEADEDLLTRTLDKPMQQALVSALAQMRDHAEPRTRAAFMALTLIEAQQATEREMPAASKSACTDASCPQSPEFAAARAALLQMASASNDPWIVQTGMLACPFFGGARGAVCVRPLVERWIEIEPRNAVPWMHLASMALEAKDDLAMAQAMRGVVGATVVDPRQGVLTHELTRHVDPIAEPLLALSLMTQGYGVEAAQYWPVQPVSRYCEAAALSDGARRNDCERIGMLFTEHSRQLLDFSIGVSIGKRLGWSADRVDRLEVQKDAMNYVVVSSAQDADDFTSCRAMARQRVTLLDTVEGGEIGAWRKRIAASGSTEAELAARYRDARRRDRDAAARSVSAESAKSSGESAVR